jgi:hypothetical protein
MTRVRMVPPCYTAPRRPGSGAAGVRHLPAGHHHMMVETETQPAICVCMFVVIVVSNVLLTGRLRGP